MDPAVKDRPAHASPASAAPHGSSEESRPPVKKKSSLVAYVVLAVLAALAVSGYAAYTWMSGSQANTDDAQVDADVVPLGARVAGQLVRLAVSDNQPVHKGDLIAELDPKDYEIRVNQAAAELEAAEALAEAAAAKGADSGVAQVMVARAALNRAQAELHKAETDLARAKKLKAERAISSVELENAQNSLDKAAAAAAQAAAQLKVAQEQHSIAEAKVKGAAAALDQAKTQLSYTKIFAPRDGFLSKLAVQPGQLIGPGQLIAQLVANETYLVANFKETQVGRMRPGQRVEIEIDAFPGRRFEGKVESLAAATGARFSLLPPDNASGNFIKVVQRVPVKIAWEGLPKDAEAVMKAGLSADVTVYFK